MNTTMRSSILASAALLTLVLSGAAQAQQAANMTFFVTSVGPGKGGDLGGLAGADAYCQTLATSVGAGGKTWHAYMSSSINAAKPGDTVNARDRIGKGPWQNAKGVVIATSVEDLHSDGNKISKESGLTEKGTIVNGVGDTPNQHDMLTGSGMDGKALPDNVNLTCNNWTSSQYGSASLFVAGRATPTPSQPWNSGTCRAVAQPDLIATGGAGVLLLRPIMGLA